MGCEDEESKVRWACDIACEKDCLIDTAGLDGVPCKCDLNSPGLCFLSYRIIGPPAALSAGDFAMESSGNAWECLCRMKKQARNYSDLLFH
ncbi:MAG: hypothetical protein A2V52_00215 [Actinobacteria bacterium RBG_19FT_COMBO_54_7]|nr:MAG: hypothetical protein A2V52_00215 [Actinobacteria bacterium RBG_19FT_COMBO_54_7]